MITISLVILGIMNVFTWVGNSKVEKDLEAARLEIEELKQILRNSEK
jgi:hypothetical protein